MIKHLQTRSAATSHNQSVDCGVDPAASLVEMFVNIVQKSRIDAGQCPALRPVFLKPHGVAKGTFKVKPDLPANLAVGLFQGSEYPLWARFSSDTLPTINDYKTTCGVGLKLFNTPTPKIIGAPEDDTFDFILQNFRVFFVDTATDMCEFTKAGVIDGDYGPYLEQHPKTAKLLDEMAQPVGSVLATAYWGILPFSLGESQYVKYLLRPTIVDNPPHEQPADPTYLAKEMADRLAAQDVTFEFCLQLRTNPETMPLDEATVAWPELESQFVPVAEVVFPKQDINARGQSEYGENLSMNIWRVTEDHRPQGSISEVRRVVYEASALQRRNANGVPVGEPVSPKPDDVLPPCKDEVIVRAAIHPGIGVARVGDAESEFFIGPEVTTPPSKSNGFYRTSQGSLKRQAARFRIYGYNAAGDVVRELTANNADITWTVHVANTKADWFHFITAMDIPETADLVVKRRNPDIRGDDRKALVIDPGPRSISGLSVSGGHQHRFHTGEFKGETVYLGELQTDAEGRLLFLGGHGKSTSPSGKPPYDPADPDSFNNAADWYDDMSDGPVSATVSISGQTVPVDSAWVVTAPPNYAPDVIGWRTLYDLLVDVYTQNGWMAVPEVTSFTKDVLPQLQRLSNLQWVNKGFATMFGKGGPIDFEDPDFVAKLSKKPLSASIDPYGALRRQMFNAFRPHQPRVNEPRLWPWLYGDDFSGDHFQASTNTMLALPALKHLHLERWASGTFEADWDPATKPPAELSDVPLAEQGAMLDQAALHFCLADAFHPGCEMTWPMRHASMYREPFRIRESAVPESPDQWGSTLDQTQVLAPNGPLYAQVPGSISRWMGLPWQGDTAYCRAGYGSDYDMFQPSFWPARVPNTVLTEADYQIVINESEPREARVAAFSRRSSWNRFIDTAGTVPQIMEKMIADFGSQGIVEARPGVKNDPEFPEVIYVENVGYQLAEDLRMAAAAAAVEIGSRQAKLAQAGWASEKHLQDAIKLRKRERIDS
ncbi:MAG: catalase [Gammaproteobacteria bacterium]|nr:catalase [Gammaproteobacteria bacterium]